MMKLLGPDLPNIPWAEKPAGCRFPLWRYSGNPVIRRNPAPSAARVFNSAVVPFEGRFAGVFRADGNSVTPRLHAGFSEDGLNWEIRDDPISWKDADGNRYQPTYAYDPRVTRIGSRFYIVWCTAFDGNPTVGIGYTDDFRTFIRLPNPLLPFNRNGVLFPKRIGGRYVLLSRPSDGGHTAFGDIYMSRSPDLCYWGDHRKVMSISKKSWWQSLKIGAGSVPIETNRGWLVFYHGVVNNCNGYVYSIGAALLDPGDPSVVLRRSKDYLLTPEADYETVGFVPNVCFPCATLFDAATGRIALYYGAADTYTAVAFTTADEIESFLEKASELVPGDGSVVR